jgi:hypothetical protein
MRSPAWHPERLRTWSSLVLVLGLGCSSTLENRPVTDDGVDPALKLAQTKIRFRNPEMAARYQAAKSSPLKFEPVYDYAKAVAEASLASLIDKECDSCGEGAVRYKRRSELEPQYWPIIEDALSMLDVLAAEPGLTPEEMERVVATKGRLLWLAGRSMEEQTLIADYAHGHPGAVAVVRRRLELLRENGDDGAIESQCRRSRSKTAAASEAVRVGVLTACVAFHPENTEGRSDLVNFDSYLPNLSPAEDALYRGHLVRRCIEHVGDEGTRCGQACACEDQDPGKSPAAKCKRACGGCRSEIADKLRLCNRLGEAPPPPPPTRATAARPKRGPAGAAPEPRTTSPKSKAARSPKDGGGSGSGAQQVEL